jgi:RNA polymerase sigma-70 factor (ECF subfamily)
MSAVADDRSGAAYSPYRDESHAGEAYAEDPYDGAAHDLTVAAPSARRPRPAPLGRNQLRADFGAHFEANYPRLVAQLYAITLNPAEAHDVVQEAYSRAWKQWASVGRLRDPAEWVRRVAVRSTIRSWRRALAAIGVGRPRPFGEIADRRTAALLAALARLSIAERRAVVLHHMVGWSAAEIAVVERSTPGAVGARLNRASQVVVEGMADVLSEVLGSYGEEYR